MDNFKIEIDLGKLEREIAEYDNVIENATKVINDAEKERALKTQLRDYILSHYSGTVKRQTLFPDIPQKLVTGERGQPTGISEFIRDYVKNHAGCHTNEIVSAYCTHKGIKRDSELSKVVSRSLTRLKKAGNIDNKLKDGGKRAGSTWTFIKSKTYSMD